MVTTLLNSKMSQQRSLRSTCLCKGSHERKSRRRGCTDNVVIEGGIRVEVDVDLIDEPLEFKGIFRTDHIFGLDDMLRGVEDGRDTIVDTFEILGAIGGAYGVEPGDPNPQANALLQLLCDRADFPGSICGLARALAAAPLQQQIDMNIDEETKNTLLILGDLYQNIDTFNVYGEIEIAASYPNEDGFLRGNTSRWHGLRFFWQTDCPFASTNPRIARGSPF